MTKLLIILLTSLFFSACTEPASKTQSQPNQKAPAAEQKQGDTTKTGTITQSGTIFFINVLGQEPEIIESYGVDLTTYVGKTVTITGQYSGDTLFVGSVE